MCRITFGVTSDDNFFLNDTAVVLQSAVTLNYRADIIFVTSIGGIKYANFAIFDETATAMTTVFVVFVAGPQRKFRIRIIDKVTRSYVHPRFIFVPIFILRDGIPLAENMINAVAIRQTVGVAYQRKRRVNVEIIMPLVSKGDCFTNIFVNRLFVKAKFNFF